MSMIEVKTADLSGAALDWAVGIAAGGEQKPRQFADNIDAPFWDAWVFPDGYACTAWKPSENWSQGGWLIYKYQITYLRDGEDYIAVISRMEQKGFGSGSNHLIAACRAIVDAKLGESVQVPAELVEVVQ